MTSTNKSNRWFSIILIALLATCSMVCVYKIGFLSEIAYKKESLITNLNEQIDILKNETASSIDKANNTTSFYAFENKALTKELQQAYATITEQEQREGLINDENNTLKNQISKLQDMISELEEEMQTHNVMYSYSTIRYTNTELEMLCFLVQKECGSSDVEHKRIIVNIVLSRVKNQQFPNTIFDVLMQEGQFTSVYDWASSNIKINENTIQAVNEVLSNTVVDNSQGALYYYSPRYVSDYSVMAWFETRVFLFEKYGHRFYK
ncbi:MAG: hypothetical protein A2Y17_07465 [Clostridiales bacterium GWF2_38_85]|nr:MAG: hypothetical protein A2Y17_07465 [Clostridiales bacterium GWF2_38_85]HBL84288.1 hypothetical protein [Clostridiales bacterium]